MDGELLLADRLADDLTVTNLVDVGIHPARDQRLAEAEGRLHGDDRAIRREGVSGEQDAGGVGEGHALHDDGHLDQPVVDAVLQAVRHGPIGEERRPAPADVLEDCRRAGDIQVRVVLARKRCCRQVLRRRARSHCVGGVVAEPGDFVFDRICHVGRRSRSPRSSRGSRRSSCGSRLDRQLERVPAGRSGGRAMARPGRSAQRRPSSRRSRTARGCRRSEKALPDERLCRRRPRSVSCRPARSRAHSGWRSSCSKPISSLCPRRSSGFHDSPKPRPSIVSTSEALVGSPPLRCTMLVAGKVLSLFAR